MKYSTLFDLLLHNFRQEDEESPADVEIKWRYRRARRPRWGERVRMQEESRGRWWCGERELNKQRRTAECALSRPRLIVSQWHIRSSAGLRITIIAPFLADPPWNVHLWKADYRYSVTGFAENRSSTFLSKWPDMRLISFSWYVVEIEHVTKTKSSSS